ncbi:MAG: hypothetical protein DMG50_05205 [Acidobacteria bacterium]|nr:MAG: hypothetical protein DMG50_05205 [Acidobacteriota bacterium]
MDIFQVDRGIGQSISQFPHYGILMMLCKTNLVIGDKIRTKDLTSDHGAEGTSHLGGSSYPVHLTSQLSRLN